MKYRITQLLIAFAISSSSYATWWEGDLSKDIVEISNAAAVIEFQETPTGYEEWDKMHSLLKLSYQVHKKSSTDAHFIILVATVYKCRNLPGVEADKLFVAARKDINMRLATWDYPVHSKTFIKVCAMYTHQFGYRGKMPPALFIKQIRSHFKEDVLFQETLADFMAYHLKEFDRSEVLRTARSLLGHKTSFITRYHIAFKPIFALAMKEKNKVLMNESIKLLTKYYEGMRVVNREDRKQIASHIEFCKQQLSQW